MRRWTVLLVILLCPAFAAAQEAAPSELGSMYDEAVAAFRDGEYARAAELFGRLHSASPSALLLYNRAYALGRAENYSVAVEAAALAQLGDLSPAHATKNSARTVAWRARLDSERLAKTIAELPRPAPVVVVETPAPPRQRSSPWLPIAIGSGVVSVAAFSVTAVIDNRIGAHAERLGDPATESTAREAIARNQRVARPLFIVGAVGAAAAVTFLVLHVSTRDREVAVGISSSGAVARVVF